MQGIQLIIKTYLQTVLITNGLIKQWSLPQTNNMIYKNMPASKGGMAITMQYYLHKCEYKGDWNGSITDI